MRIYAQTALPTSFYSHLVSLDVYSQPDAQLSSGLTHLLGVPLDNGAVDNESRGADLG